MSDKVTISPKSNLTVQERCEKFNRSLLTGIHEASPDGILVVDENGNAVSFNQRFLDIWQIPDKYVDPQQVGNSPVADKSILLAVKDQLNDPEGFLNRVKELYADPCARDHRELTLKDGRTIVRHTVGLFDDQENYVGRVWFFRDITARKKDEAERLELESQLHQRSKMEAIGQMAGGIAHNCNNHLSIILGNVDLALLYLNQDSKILPLMEDIKTAVGRSQELVKGLLSYSRKGFFQEEDIQPAQLLDEIWSFLRSSIPTTVEMFLYIDPDSRNAHIRADGSQIQEVLLNLCTNAVDAMGEKGRLTISLDLQTLSKDEIPVQFECAAGLYLRLAVADTGCGITKEIREKIFLPFFTTKDITSRAGMGLALVQGVIDQHKGLIKVDSTPGKGTVFHLYFPVSKRDSRDDTGSSFESEESLSAGRERILFVDDEEMLLHVGKTMLTMENYEVTATTSSVEGWEIFKSNPSRFDLIIVDQTMPGLSGEDFLQKVLAIRPNMPTILCTGYSSKIDDEKAHTLGLGAFLMKPLSRTELLQATRRVLGKREH